MSTFDNLYDFFKTHASEIADYLIKNSAPIIAFFDKKKLAVLGPVGVGKNCFYDRLQELPFPENAPPATVGKEPISTFKVKFTLPSKSEIVMYCKGCNNVSGEEREAAAQPREHWKEAIDDADLIFYILDYDTHFKNADYRYNGRVHRDIKWLSAMMHRLDGNVKVHFFINKIDAVIKDATELDKFTADHREKIEEFKSIAVKVFGLYANRLTGHVTPISLKDDHIWAHSFAQAIAQIHKSSETK